MMQSMQGWSLPRRWQIGMIFFFDFDACIAVLGMNEVQVAAPARDALPLAPAPEGLITPEAYLAALPTANPIVP